MAKNKLLRFEEIKRMSNVFEFPSLKGQWHTIFKNDYPIILELACGKGEYVNGLSNLYPNKNFIGIDIKGNRIWTGARYALQNNKNNVAFIRGYIDHIEDYFTPHEVSEIWITFPDPFLSKSKIKKRLTHSRFLQKYAHILKPQGQIKLKTDSPDLFLFTKEIIQEHKLKIIEEIENINTIEKLSDELNIKTHYEQLNISKSNKTFYLCFELVNKFL